MPTTGGPTKKIKRVKPKPQQGPRDAIFQTPRKVKRAPIGPPAPKPAGPSGPVGTPRKRVVKRARPGPPAPKPAAGPAGPVGKQITDPKIIARRKRYGPDVKVFPLGKGQTTGLNAKLGDVGEAIGRPLKPVVEDYGNTILNLIPGTAHLAYTAVTDPKKAAHEFVQPYKDIYHDPVGSFKSHPFSTTIAIAAPVAGGLRGAGALARRGTFGAAAKGAASTARAPAKLEFGATAHPRRYSPNPVAKAVQVKLENRAVRKGKDPTQITSDQLKKRVNEVEGINQSVARHQGQQVSQAARAAISNTTVGRGRVVRRANKQTRIKPVEGATSLVAQNIVKPTRGDLQAYLDEIKAQHPSLTPVEKATNEQLQHHIQNALDSNANFSKVAEAAQRYQQVERPITEKAVQYKILNADQAARRREQPFAARQPSVTYGKPAVTADVPGARRVLRQTQVQRAKLERTRRTQAERAGRAQGRAEILGGQSARRAGIPVGDVTKPVRTLSKLERERGKLTAQDLQVRSSRAKVRAAEQVLAETKRLAKQQRREPKQFLKSGQPYSTAAIRAERQATGHPEPAYVSQAANLTRPGSFYRHYSNPVQVAGKKFTGASTKKGTFDASNEALHANVRRIQTLVNAHEGHMRFTREFGMRDQQGNLLMRGSKAAVQKEIDARTLDAHGKPLPHAREWSIVRAAPFGASHEHVQGFLESAGQVDTPQPILDSVTQALNGQGDHGPFVAVPKVVRDQQLAHVRVLGQQAPKVINVLSTLWRKNVLAFSVKWATSNVGEATFRSLVAGVRKGDRALFNSALEELRKVNPEAAQTIEGSIGHGHYGFTLESQRHTRADEFKDIKYVRQIARALGTASRTKGVSWLPKAYGAFTGYVFHHMSQLEDQFRFAMAGTHIRKNILDAGIDKTAEAAIKDAAQGLTHTHNQTELLRFVQRAYGQYEGWSPEVRNVVQHYTPFLAWTANAVKFLFHVLPKDHPVLLGLAANIEASQREWLKSVGLEVGQRDALPGYLLGSVVTGKGAAYPEATRYTPLGLLQNPTQSIAGLVMPQFRDVQMALQGLDAFGQPLKESKLTAIAKGFSAMLLPGGGQIANAATGPGSFGSQLAHQLNPVAATPPDKVEYARAKATGDRLKKEIQGLPRDQRAKDAAGNYTPAYQRLLDEQANVQYTKTRLLNKSGLAAKPTVELDRKIQLLNRKIRDLPKARKVNDLGFATKEYADLQAQRKALQDERAKIAPRANRQKIRVRPKTPRQQILDETARLKKSTTPEAIRKELRDEINRLKEQARVNRGG